MFLTLWTFLTLWAFWSYWLFLTLLTVFDLYHKCTRGPIVGRLRHFFRPFQKSKNIARIMSHSVTIWRNVNVASFFAPDNGTYLWSQILIYWLLMAILGTVLYLLNEKNNLKNAHRELFFGSKYPLGQEIHVREVAKRGSSQSASSHTLVTG